jgi:hypothetical protein
MILKKKFNTYKYIYIYKIKNTIDNKIYVGQRYSNKLPELDSYLGSGKILKNKLRTYSKNFFEKTILEIIFKNNKNLTFEEYLHQKEIINKREIFWITFYNATDSNIGYNISKGGNFLITAHTKESRLKISNATKGVKKKPFSEEHKKNIGISQKGKLKGPQSEEHRRNSSLSHIGKKYRNKTKEEKLQRSKGFVLHYFNNKLVQEFVSIGEASLNLNIPKHIINSIINLQREKFNEHSFKLKDKVTNEIIVFAKKEKVDKRFNRIISDQEKQKRLASNTKYIYLAYKYPSMDFVGEFFSSVEAAKKLNITNNISQVISNKRKHIQYYTFIRKFKNNEQAENNI